MTRFDVRASPELRATIAAFRAADRTVRNGMRRAARRTLNAEWRPALERMPATTHQKRVLVAGARADVRTDEFRMLAATSRRRLTGGLMPADEWHGAEFGASTNPRVEVSWRGTTRKQRINRQFGRRKSTGKVVYPVARQVGPKIVAAWIRGAVAGLLAGTDIETT